MVLEKEPCYSNKAFEVYKKVNISPEIAEHSIVFIVCLFIFIEIVLLWNAHKTYDKLGRNKIVNSKIKMR